MGLEDEYLRAVDMIRAKASLRTPGDCNVFETTIRVVGGSLAGYFEAMASTNERVQGTAATLLDVATTVGSRLMKAFDDSPTAMPLSDVDLSTGDTSGSATHSSLSEMTTLALEFATLSNLTGDGRFRSAAEGVYDALPQHGLLPRLFNPRTGQPADTGYLMLGSRADSYYEYLLKYWIMLGDGKDSKLYVRYRRAMDAIKSELLSRTKGERRATYVAELRSGVKISKMDHLVCFLPGVIALGYWHGANDASELRIAEELLETCVMLYKNTPTGLAAEISYLNDDERGEFGAFDVKDQDAHNLLRPETLESLFVMWAVTGRQKHRDDAWDIFMSFEEHCGGCGPADGYCGIRNVKNVIIKKKKNDDDDDDERRRIDKMESFWTAETLKYLWCIFQDVESCGDRVLGGGWVLNTEAHWLRTM